MPYLYKFFTLSFLVLALSGCSGASIEKKYPTSSNRELSDDRDIYTAGKPGLFNGGKLFSGKKGTRGDGAGIGVNAYLWRASLDTISFMPLRDADPFGGTIFTDWYEESEKPGERYKLNVLILDSDLRVDALRVTVFKQVRQKGTWRDTTPPSSMRTTIEDSILTRARALRANKISALD